MIRRLLAVVVVAGFAAAAAAQVRTIPPDAKPGKMRHLQDTAIEIDGKPARLAPGAQIRDASNRVIIPTALPAGSQVKYLLDAEGKLRRAWILTPEEAAKK